MSLLARASALVLLVVASACQLPGSQPAAGPAPLPPSPPPVPSSPPAPAPPSAPRPDGAECRNQAECAAGRACVYDEAGCAAAGHCRETGAPSRACNVAIAMCACRDRHSFYGPGGCAGQASEPWELYACSCASDADCGGGQRCVPTGARPHAPGATHECRPPDDVR